MTDISNAQAVIEQLLTMASAGGASGSPPPPLNPPDGGGTSGGMEARIARLESDMEHVKNALERLDRSHEALRQSVDAIRVESTTIRGDVGVLVERVSHLPTISKLWAAVGTSIAALAAIVAMIVRFLPHAG